MHPTLADHVRALELRLADLEPEALHTAQIAACRECLAQARDAADDAAYLAATGDLLPLPRAEWVDRYNNAAALYRDLGDEAAAGAAEASAAAAAAAASHRELLAATLATRPGVSTAAGDVGLLVRALLEWRADRSPSRRDRLDAVAAIWSRLLGSDPDFGLERLRHHPPYRHRLPFADAAVEVVGGWLDAAEEEMGGPPQPTAPPPAPPPPTLPGEVDRGPRRPATAAEVGAGYRATFEAIDRGDPRNAGLLTLYRRVLELVGSAASGDALLVAMAEEKLHTALAREPLRAAADDARASLDERAQPLAAGHYRRLEDDLARARTTTAVEWVQLAADLQLQVESAWLNLLCSAALAPLGAAAGCEIDGSEARRQSVALAESASRALFGAATPALLEAPALYDVFRAQLFERGQVISLDGGADVTAIRGEVALDVAGAVRGAAIQWAIDQVDTSGLGFDEAQARIRERMETPRFATPEAMRDHLLSLHRAATAGAKLGDVPGDPPPLCLWDRPVALAELHRYLGDPPRPLPRLGDL